MLWTVVQSLINGIFSGGVYALIAVGISIVFGVMRMINFASGAFLMLGMYFTWLAYQLIPVEIYYLIPIAFLMSMLFSYIVFRLTLKPILNADRSAAIIVTVGLSFLLQNLVGIVFGNLPLTLNTPIKSIAFNVGDYVISAPRALAFLMALVLTLAVNFLITKTSFGRCMRATSENSETAQMLGIKTSWVFSLAWAIGIGMTGIAGLLVVPLYTIEPAIGGVFRSTGLMAVVLGGLSNIKGAFIGGIILGVVEALVAALIAPDLGPAGMFVLFLLILHFKPHGLFGKGERIA